MPTSTKISISLPRATLEIADRERRSTGESRSEYFRRAIDVLLEQERRKAAVERYQAGYVAEPEEEYEVEGVDALGQEVLEREPWD